MIEIVTDVELMTAREKEMVLTNWETFPKHGLKQQLFTKWLYEHLHLHCGFIAHYNLETFYSTYFTMDTLYEKWLIFYKGVT